MGDLDFSINIDATEALKGLQDVEIERKAVEERAKKTVEFVSTMTKKTYRRIGIMARSAWMATQGILEASGVSISGMFAALLQSAISSIAVLTPLFAATATAGDYVRASVGFFEIMMTLSAMITAQAQKREAEAAMRDAMSIIGSAGSFLYTLTFFMG